MAEVFANMDETVPLFSTHTIGLAVPVSTGFEEAYVWCQPKLTLISRQAFSVFLGKLVSLTKWIIDSWWLIILIYLSKGYNQEIAWLEWDIRCFPKRNQKSAITFVLSQICIAQLIIVTMIKSLIWSSKLELLLRLQCHIKECEVNVKMARTLMLP